MIFSRKKYSFDNVTITLNGVALTRVREAKFLGIILTEDLRWKKQVDMVVQKTSKVLGILYRVSHILDKDRLKLLYCTLFEPYIAYCGTVWSSHKNGNMDRILRLQKRAIRIITHSSFLAHSASLFKALNILTIYDLTHLSVLVYMFR